jgi:hypothetical protein
MESNPYSSPTENIYGINPGAAQQTVTDGVLDQLGRTKPWIRFFAVLAFVGAAFLLLGALGMLAMGGAGMFAKSSSGSNPMGPMAGAMGIGMAVLYGVLSIVYIFPGIKLWKYANRISTLLVTRTNFDLEAALNEQRSFWKFLGILVIAMIALYFVAIIAFIIFGAAAAMHMKP